MVEMKVHLNEDDTLAVLEFPDRMLKMTAEQLESFMAVLFDVRSKMQPPMELPSAGTLN